MFEVTVKLTLNLMTLGEISGVLIVTYVLFRKSKMTVVRFYVS